MRRFFFIVFIFFISCNCFCQALRQGDVTLNVYYGYNVFTGFVKSLAQASNSGSLPTNVKVSSIGPVGITGEYMLSHMLGIGGEIGYNQTKLTYNNESINNSGALTPHSYIWSVGTTRIMGRFNFHFGDNENFDIYPFIAAGLRLSSTRLRTDDPILPSVTSPNFIPIGIKPGLGLRYFFSPNVGLFSEVAIGTPLLSIGISFKFKNANKTED